MFRCIMKYKCVSISVFVSRVAVMNERVRWFKGHSGILMKVSMEERASVIKVVVNINGLGILLNSMRIPFWRYVIRLK